MKFNIIYNQHSPGNLVLFLLICLFTFPAGHVTAQKKSKKKAVQYEAELSLATIYDNNILKYSDKYLDRFMNNQDPGRFHIETYDDVILYQSADVSASFRIIKNLKSKVNFNIFNNLYVVNGIKNWYSASIGFQQYLSKRASFKIFYAYLPDFYVRHFRDEDLVEVYGYIPKTFVPFSFAKDNYGFWIQNTFFKSTRVKFSFDYSKYYYNQHYTEYDSKNFLYGFFLYQEVINGLRLEIGYHWLTSDAKGYDQPGETKETSDDADATFEEDGYRFGVIYDLPRIKKFRHDIDAELEFERRYYTTHHYVEVDPEHAGRVDNALQLNVTYNFELSRSWQLAAFYNFFFRDTYSSSKYNQAYLSAEKDFNQSQFGLKAVYLLKF